jgi:trans-aconitate methyltransferase
MKSMASQTWNARTYAENAHFVPALGQAVLELLDPQVGERILDLGCGDGVLTEKIAGFGAMVIGVDSSAEMVTAAQLRGIQARVMDGYHLSFAREFDAVFSNASLHWMIDPDAVIAGVRRALKPGGRFVGELGGHGNVAAIMTALIAVVDRYGIEDAASHLPWYYPTVEAYTAKLEAAGFAVEKMELIPRPTPLPTGMHGWLRTFAMPLLTLLPEGERDGALDRTVELLRPALCDEKGRWTADYVRLRFRAKAV